MIKHDFELKQKIHNNIVECFKKLNWNPRIFFISYGWWKSERLIYIDNYDSSKEIYGYPTIIRAFENEKLIYEESIND